MGRPRVQLTVRRLMFLVATAAVLSAAARLESMWSVMFIYVTLLVSPALFFYQPIASEKEKRGGH